MQGDQVLVEVEPPKADGRRIRAASFAFWSAATPPSSAYFTTPTRSRHRQNVVVPFDERMTQPILIPPGQKFLQTSLVTIRPVPPSIRIRRRGSGMGRNSRIACSAAKQTLVLNLKVSRGLVVDVEITSWPTPTRPPIGRVIEVLGDRRTTSASTWK